MGIVCAIGAVGPGLAYLLAAGAPVSYLALNAAALAIGLLAVGILGEAGRVRRAAGGVVLLALAAIVLLTSLFGVSANAVTRWFVMGGLVLQPGLILVPVIVLGFVRAPGRIALLAVFTTALGLAQQPDRAMAGALAAGLAAAALLRPGRISLLALSAPLAAFVATLAQADASPAMPFVDQIFRSSFAVHPLTGLTVLAGAMLLLVPALLGFVQEPAHRPLHAAFGAIWLAAIVAAALGNYPTPLVGYGGSAILGYLLGLLALPRRREAMVAPAPVEAAGTGTPGPPELKLRTALSRAG